MDLRRFITFSILAALSLTGGHLFGADATINPPALGTITNGSFHPGTEGWKIWPEVGPIFSLSDATPPGANGKAITYRCMPGDTFNYASFSQVVTFKGGTYYKLAFKYKGDGKLAPIVVIRELSGKDPVRRLLRLKSSDQWESYEMELEMSRIDGDFELQFCPGTKPARYLKDDGTPDGNHSGECSFAEISLSPTGRVITPAPKGPFQVKSEEIVYKKAGNLDLRLILDLPEGAPGPFPILIMVHGGGWAKGSPEVMSWQSKFVVERGIATARIQYRLLKDGGTFPTTISDVMDSIDWVRRNASKYNLDLTRLGLNGGSAGAHLSSIAAQRAPDCGVYIGYCGLYDAFNVGEGLFARNSSFLGKSPEDRKEASAIYQIKTPPPATLLFHGKADPTIDYMQAVRFNEALKAKGARTELILNEGCGHEVGEWELTDRKLLEFLNREWKLDMKY